MKQQNELFCTAKNNWKWMAPEDRHIKITNGRVRSYLKNKVDTF